MRSSTTARIAAVALATLAATQARAQQSTSAAAPAAPEVGTLAPDFSLPGATRFGTLRDPVKLSDFRGKTVVLAFFYRARTKG
jgi:peroxiredoxin Q/BCP